MQTTTESTLSPAQSKDLRLLSGIMIPASMEFDVPGADDPTIFADIEMSLGRDCNDVQKALAGLCALAGGAFADLEPSRREAVAELFLMRVGPEVTTLGRVILSCYYRDDRVVRSLGLEPRPPFPLGHTLEQGDWSLLERVKKRSKLWRDAP